PITARSARQIVEHHLANARHDRAGDCQHNERAEKDPMVQLARHDGQNRKYRNSLGCWVTMNEAAMPNKAPAATAQPILGCQAYGCRRSAGYDSNCWVLGPNTAIASDPRINERPRRFGAL